MKKQSNNIVNGLNVINTKLRTYLIVYQPKQELEYYRILANDPIEAIDIFMQIDDKTKILDIKEIKNTLFQNTDNKKAALKI